MRIIFSLYQTIEKIRLNFYYLICKGGKKFNGTEVLGENHCRLWGFKNERNKHKYQNQLIINKVNNNNRSYQAVARI